jgi:hypothetical protein
LRATPTVLKWGVLVATSLAFIVPLQLMHLPAAQVCRQIGVKC